ncbi:MAG: gamma-glutamyl phosphate reductase [Acidobacteria bacterium]|nr:gamma-glutamyl phosphate reductase [Acidobacteriota bacterium]
MKVESLVPRSGEADLSAVLKQVGRASSPPPFSEAAVDFCAAFATRLGRDPQARRYPELTALAFWIRRAELERLRREFAALENDSLLRAPRGLVFHVPPGNVDTMFVYSWLLGLLCGNRNIIRLSRNRDEPVEILCRIAGEALAEADPLLQAGNAVVSYAHEAEINAALSAACDTRVVWGGDSTVALFRHFPLAPHGTEIVFPDRFSFAALRAEAVLALDEAALAQLAEQFYNDAYWFHQLGCSSPRLAVWVGTADACRAAGDRFFPAVAETVRRKHYELPAAARMRRFTFECESILDRPVAGRRDLGRELACLRLETLEDFSREHCGGGLFWEYFAEHLGEIETMLDRRDQTLTHFGFPADELRAAARAWNGRGLDRIVPVGRALQFDRYWDGMDLFAALTRCVAVQS